ncbi:AAA family ATPase [Saccharothrix hoggarensis]|uniref:AAA family ATPase n=1 Tax=Saccharothrix hoggarensis TaxID=913853 RepID=A0ABW3QZ35_9PSEU
MIIWLNGTFGAGKTTTARELTGLVPSARVFDSEHVGYLLRHVLTEPVENFQDWPPWRSLVVHTAVETLRYVGGALVIPQTVLTEAYYREIDAGLRAAGLDVRHFVLHAREDVLVGRIEADRDDPGARQWRLDHVERYRAAVPWLHAAAEVVDTTDVPAAEVARTIAHRCGLATDRA